MSITNIRCSFGLSMTGGHTREGVSGSVAIGIGNQAVRLTDSDGGATARIIAHAGSSIPWNFLTNGDDYIAGDTWTAGTQQVETATAAGAITASGNASVTVTSAGMAGSPLTLSVPVLNGDTASVWAGKVREALAANSVIAARFSVGGTGTAILLERKEEESVTVKEDSYVFTYANDTTLNIALDNGTCTGITTASTSVNTTLGVASSGYKVFNAGISFDGSPVSLGPMYALDIRCNLGYVQIVGADYGSGGDQVSLDPGGRVLLYKAGETLADSSIEVTIAVADIEICVAGVSSL